MVSEEALNELRTLSEGDAEFFKKILNAFLQTVRERLPMIEESVNFKSAEKIAVSAHSLKSSSYNIGAAQMGDLCFELEKMGKAGSLAEVDKVFASLKEEAEKVCQEIESLPEMKSH